MLTSKSSWLKLSFLSAGVLTAAVFASPMQAQSAPPVHVGGTTITGIPEDWSSRHVVFSKVETEDEALQKGHYANWQKIVNDPRYVMQQLKHHQEVQGPAATEAAYRLKWILGSSHESKKPETTVKRDWSEALGGPGLAADQYPAKYDFATTTSSCSDFVVYPTGATSSATQATIVAFNSVYSGCPLYNNDPAVYWAYNTGGTTYKANTSPVFSSDGRQVAFVQSNGTTAQLVLLKTTASGGTVAAPIVPALAATAALYQTCAAPCYYTFSLGANDSNSAPFYVFDGTDTLYVGDDAGKMHKVVGAFAGTPAFDSTTGWPVTASTEAHPELYSPVYDAGTSARIFVTDESGYLHSFTATGTPGTVGVTGHLETNTTFVFDPVVVDSTTELVYAFVGYSGDAGNTNPSYINRFPAGTAFTGGTTGTGVPMGNGNATTNPATSNMETGTFDNEYYTGTGTTGNLYVCENGTLYQIPLATFTTPVVNVYNKAVSTNGPSATCSPVTEFLGVKSATTLSANLGGGVGNTTATVTSGTGIANGDYIQIDSEILKVTVGGGTGSLTVTRAQDGTTRAAHTNGATVQDIQDWLFTSVAALGNEGGCTGACIYNFNVINTAATTGTPVTGLAAAGGTSGIVIDSSSLTITGDQEVYYTLLGGTSAIQASQAALQ